MTEDDALAAARQAAAELPLVQSIFDSLQAEMWKSILESGDEDVAKRERLVTAARLLTTVKSLVIRAAQHADLESFRDQLAASGLTRP